MPRLPEELIARIKAEADLVQLIQSQGYQLRGMNTSLMTRSEIDSQTTKPAQTGTTTTIMNSNHSTIPHSNTI